MTSTNIFILVLLLISIVNNFWMYHIHNSRISNNIASEDVKYKNFIIFYNPSNENVSSNKIDAYINKLTHKNQTIIFNTDNSPMDFRKIDFNKVNLLAKIK